MNPMSLVLESYNEEDKKYLMQIIRICAVIGRGQAPTTPEEFRAWCELELQDRDKEEEKKRKAEEKKQATLERKAAELGLSIEDYKEYTRLLRNKKRKDTEIRNITEKYEEELKELKESFEYWKKKLETFEKEKLGGK